MKQQPKDFTPEQLTIYELSEQLIKTQRPLRILDSLKWDEKIQQEFFKNKCRELPTVTPDYYRAMPLAFRPEEKEQEFYALELTIQKRLGNLSGLGNLLQRMCREYRTVIRLIQARGTPEFVNISQALYGSSDDVFYVGGPSIKDLSTLLGSTLPTLSEKTLGPADVKQYNSQQAVEILHARLANYFNDPDERISVQISDNIIADAAAGAEVIKLRRDAIFSERDLRLLEVHEGWVHLATTLNGLNQPICTFLSKGPPTSTITQEGLAVMMELFTFSSFPARLQRLTNRIIAINMAEHGADFLEIFRFFQEQGYTEEESYGLTVRVFRGGLPDGTTGPFTKDLAYNKGFVLIYNYIRLAIQYGVLEQIPLLFLGKTTLEDLPLFIDLIQQNIVVKPKYVPPQFKDLAALSSWMSYSLFMNKVDIQKLAMDFRAILRL